MQTYVTQEDLLRRGYDFKALEHIEETLTFVNTLRYKLLRSVGESELILALASQYLRNSRQSE